MFSARVRAVPLHIRRIFEADDVSTDMLDDFVLERRRPGTGARTMKAILTSNYVRLVAVLAVAAPLAVTCGGTKWG
jgi:hypothetical protein